MEVIYVDGYDGTVKEVFGPVTFDLSGIKVLDYLDLCDWIEARQNDFIGWAD